MLVISNSLSGPLKTWSKGGVVCEFIRLLPLFYCKEPHYLQSNQLSIEKILLETIHAWSYVRLTELQHSLQQLHIATDCKLVIYLLALAINLIKPIFNL